MLVNSWWPHIMQFTSARFSNDLTKFEMSQNNETNITDIYHEKFWICQESHFELPYSNDDNDEKLSIFAIFWSIGCYRMPVSTD